MSDLGADLSESIQHILGMIGLVVIIGHPGHHRPAGQQVEQFTYARLDSVQLLGTTILADGQPIDEFAHLWRDLAAVVGEVVAYNSILWIIVQPEAVIASDGFRHFTPPRIPVASRTGRPPGSWPYGRPAPIPYVESRDRERLGPRRRR